MAGRKFVKLTAEPSNEEINLRVYSSFSHIKPDSALHENEYRYFDKLTEMIFLCLFFILFSVSIINLFCYISSITGEQRILLLELQSASPFFFLTIYNDAKKRVNMKIEILAKITVETGFILQELSEIFARMF